MFNFDNFEFDKPSPEPDENVFDPIPEWEEITFAGSEEFVNPVWEAIPEDFWFIADAKMEESFRRDDLFRYADESEPEPGSLRGPFRTLERAEAYTRKFEARFSYDYIYDGWDDVWYVEVYGSP